MRLMLWKFRKTNPQDVHWPECLMWRCIGVEAAQHFHITLPGSACWRCCVLRLQRSAPTHPRQDTGCHATLKRKVLGSCAGEVPAMPARDHRRTAKKLADAGRWAESVQVAQERGTLDDALLLRAVDGLADQVTI